MAILLDDAARGELGAAIERLRPVARDVAWVVPGNLHLTLKFLGGVDEDRIGELTAAIAGAASGVAAFAAGLRGLGAFPSLTRPRVIWAGFREGAEVMAALADRVDAALASLGFTREARPFSAHITLGRVRQPGRNPGLSDALRTAEGYQFGRIGVARVTLMRSELSPRGVRYSELASVRLGEDAGHGI